MRTILIECDKFIRSQAQQNARIVLGRITKELGASCGNLVKRCNGNGIGLCRPRLLPQFASCRDKGSRQKCKGCQSEKFRELPSCCVTVLANRNRKILFPALNANGRSVGFGTQHLHSTRPDRKLRNIDHGAVGARHEIHDVEVQPIRFRRSHHLHFGPQRLLAELKLLDWPLSSHAQSLLPPAEDKAPGWDKPSRTWVSCRCWCGQNTCRISPSDRWPLRSAARRTDRPARNSSSRCSAI